MTFSFPDHQAPPARQASNDDLAGYRGDGFDLPLTAYFSRHSEPVELAVIVTAIAAALIFVVPLLVR